MKSHVVQLASSVKSRRSIVVAALVMVAAVLPASAPVAASGDHRRTPAIDQPLRALADRVGLRIGTAVDMSAFNNDTVYHDRIGVEFSAVTAENVMKWGEIERVQGEPDYTLADQLVASARASRQKVHGHTLLWHNQLPQWLTDGVTAGTIDAAELRRLLRKHIFEVAGHFRGKIWHWDVVNEVIDDSGNLRDTIFLRLLGPGYIADAFRWAKQADPHAKLYLNDYNLEFPGAKSDAYYALAQQLLAQRVPVDGLGAQGHLGIQFGLPSAQDTYNNLRRFEKLGLEISFTEVDIRMILPTDVYRTQAQAQGFSGLLTACLLLERCEMFTFWGFTDKYSWVPGFFTNPPEGDATMLNEDFTPKPAYREMQAILAMA
jgi:endo-1,4-beta-xylanase